MGPVLEAADAIVSAHAIHPFDGSGRIFRSLAIRGARLIALDEAADGLDALRGPGTQVVDARDLTVVPGLFDSHNHMLAAAAGAGAVQLGDARSIDDVLRLLAERAAELPEGAWIVPSRNWHETNLDERRLPTGSELDRVSSHHPIALRRGGHVMVANSAALQLAGITADSPDPDGGTVERDAGGQPTGLLVEGPAFAPVARLLPVVGFDEQVDALARICRAYNACGITAVRDPGLGREQFRIYQRARDRGLLTVRSTLMMRLAADWDADRMIEEIESWPVRTGLGDQMLRLGGVKLFLDGGVEGAAFCDPYANDAAFRGHQFLTTDELTRVVAGAVDRGWEVGCHALGDRALQAALDAYEAVSNGRRLRRGHLVLEHGFFADEQTRRRIVKLGVGVCVQHPLVYFLGGNMLRYWGSERTAAALPIKEWVDDGALVAAGSDHDITFYNPLKSIWGMVTRDTATAGHQGEEHAVSRDVAFRLYTVAGAELIGERDRGALAPGCLADLVAFPSDPLSCPLDDLPTLSPAVTVVGGEPVHDPADRFARS
jgi:predicted amidohydrolase YtcJ